jgi:hypothetical protein
MDLKNLRARESRKNIVARDAVLLGDLVGIQARPQLADDHIKGTRVP